MFHATRTVMLALITCMVCPAPNQAEDAGAASKAIPDTHAISSHERARLLDDLAKHLAAHERGARWQSSDSAILAWSCGQQLSAQVDLFLATNQRRWLDQLVRYADAMFANLTPNREGFLSWRTRLYSRFHIAVRRDERNRSTVAPDPPKQWVRQDQAWLRELLRPGKEPRDWEYRLTWRDGSKVELRGATTGKLSATVQVAPGKAIAPLPGVAFSLREAPAQGDVFLITVQQPKDFDCAVHDGVILTPICRFIALVRTDPELRKTYGQKADSYLKIIESDLIPKWKPYWRDWKDGGLLVAQKDEALAYPGISLPHNQYLALGNALVWLHRITGNLAYRNQAAKMARFFKSCLRPVDDHYAWNYWDATGDWDRDWDRPEEKRAEDTGHGSLDIGFVVDAAEDGIVFDRTDLRRLANTFLKVMWNGSLSNPTVGGYVNSAVPTRQSGNLQDWLRLSREEPQVLPVCARIIQESGSIKAKAQLLRWLAEEGKRQRY